MKKFAKALLVVLCALILVVGSVFGTLAYLTSTDEVTNTFTVGNVVITMDEAVVDEYGQFVTDATNRTTEPADGETEGNAYKIIPGHSYVKDPTIYLDAESEDCYLFVDIQNGIADIEAAGDTSIAEQLENQGWVLVDGETTVYYNTQIASNDDGGQTKFVVFSSFEIDSAKTYDQIKPYENATVVVTAYAVQVDTFEDANDAWANTFGA